MRKQLAALLAGLLSQVLLSQGVVAQGQLTIEDAWVRALPPTQPMTAAYATLVNSGDVDIHIASASAAGAGLVEIHQTRKVDGLMRMEQLKGLTVPAGGKVALEPGGIHFMLLALKAMPVAGTTVSLCVTSDADQQVCTSALVRKSAAHGGSSGPHKHH